MFQNVIYALIATACTWFITLLGAGTTIFFKKTSYTIINIIIGFSAGIMVASSVWSLIIPSLKLTNGLIVFVGILTGSILLYLAENKITKLRNFENITDRSLLMMIISITIHNIPEGLAIGLAFGSLERNDTQGLLGAIALAVGIGIQNFPEGAAISLPLMSSGLSKRKSFIIGQASALVEPVFGIIGALTVTLSKTIIPFCLAFAAGCMIFVVIEDLIPQATSDGNREKSGFAFMFGFCVMMLLDVML